MTTIRGLLLLMRPPNSLMIGLGVMVGYAAASRSLSVFGDPVPLLGFLTGFFISSFSMTMNDIKDVEADRVNQPSRPIASGVVSVGSARLWAAILLGSGMLASIPTGVYTFVYAVLFAGLAWVYSNALKRYGLAGNIVVAASVAAPFPYGGLLVNALTDPYVLLLTFTAFLSALGREVVKGIPDVKGDGEIGFRTVAVAYGEKPAGRLASFFFVLASFISLIPVMTNIAGPLYFPTIILPALLHVYLAARIFKSPVASQALRVKKLALPAMALGLLAFTLGGVGRP